MKFLKVLLLFGMRRLNFVQDLPKSEALDSIKCNVFVVSLIGRLLLNVKRSYFWSAIFMTRAISSTNKTDRHDIIETLMEVVLNTITPYS
jgi:hypothetical protein